MHLLAIFAVCSTYEQGQEDLQFVSGLFKYAQEFVETLERTVDADEVLFVCAFAIYQNEVQSMRSAKQDNVPMSIISCVLVSSLQDGAGPTVSQQIGASMNSSPFGRVLKNIQVFLDSYLCISKVSATVFVLAGASSRGRLVVVATWHFTPATRWGGQEFSKVTEEGLYRNSHSLFCSFVYCVV